VIYTIPLPQPPIYDLTFQVELDQVTYTLTFQWNVRDGGWYLTIADAVGNPILGSQRVVVDFPIGLNQSYNPSMPPGSIQFIDTSGQGLDPALDGSDLGGRVQMLYFDAAEIVSQLTGGPTNVPG
jgi:hypothetical protein